MGISAQSRDQLQDTFSPHQEPAYFNKRLLLESPTADEIVEFAKGLYFTEQTISFIETMALRANSPEFKTSNKDRIDAEIQTCKFKIDVSMGSMNLPREDVERGEFHDICQAIIELWEHNKCSTVRDETGDNMFKAQTQDRAVAYQNQRLDSTEKVSQLPAPQPDVTAGGFRIPVISSLFRSR